MAQRGRVAHWNLERDYGFVTPDGGGDDIFVHATDIDDRGTLLVGDIVDFEMGENRRTGRRKAVNVTVIASAA